MCHLFPRPRPIAFVAALARLPFGLAVTLGCLGPLYELPLAYALRGRRPARASVLGVLIAVAGVAALCL